QSLLVKEAGGQIAPTQIVIQVAGWAAGQQGRQLSAPAPARVPEPEVIDLEERSHGDMSTPPSPPLDEDRRDRERAAAAATPPTPIYAVDPRPDVPKRVVAEVSARRGHVSVEERLRKGGFLGPGREAAPDAPVIQNFNLFGK